MAKKKKRKSGDDSKSKPKSNDPDPNIYYGFGEFTLPNGDNYIGDYCAHRSGIIWREGHGIYRTQDGQVYEGQWADDKLVENKEVIITYNNGAQYQGAIAKNKYQGAGTYILECQMNVSCEFSANKPVGNVTLIDCQGKLWKGVAKENSAILLPENVFYLNLNDFKGKGLSKEPVDVSGMLPSSSESSKENVEELSDRAWEKVIFAKSNLTEDDVDLTDCQWWKNYDKFRRRYDEIKTKIDEEIGLEEEDYTWVEKLKKFKRKRKAREDAMRMAWESEEKEVFNLNEKFRSKDFVESCPPVSVLYPRRKSVDKTMVPDGKSLDNIASTSDHILPIDKDKIIYVNSSGELTNPPPSLTVPSEDLTRHSSTSESSSNYKIASSQVEDLTVQFNESVQRSKELIKPLGGKPQQKSHKSSTRRIPRCYELDEEVLHFTEFRKEMILERKKLMKEENEYQAKKTHSTQEHLGGQSRSKDSTCSKKGSETKQGSNVKIWSGEKKSSFNFDLRPSKMDAKVKTEIKITECVEKFLSKREDATQTYGFDEERRRKAVHTHSVAAHTESLTGIPRKLLLG